MLALFAPDDPATTAIGSALARVLRPGDVIALDGDLGTGKTALARAIIRARLADPELEVPSPTFAILQPYPGIIHADLYRLAYESEIFELGVFDDEDAILLVEWPQRAPILFDRDGLKITIEMAEAGAGRRIGVKAMGHRDLAPVAAALAPWAQERFN